MATLSFKPKSVTKQFISCLKERTKDIVVQRFGLGENVEKMTLEAIGDQYGITRERVRQITNFAFNVIKENPAFESAADVFAELKEAIEQKGRILSEKDVLSSLSGDPSHENHVYFLLVLGDEFTKLKEDDEFHHRWTISQETADKIHDALRSLHNDIKEDDLVAEKHIVSSLKKYAENATGENISEEVARRWLNISKVIGANALGEWGLSVSPSIKPRGVRDLAYLVLRKEGSPMHFTEVAQKISSHFSKPANPATVHNELIKDGRFVLVGRGLYALSDWGYKYGTVRDIIKFIIKSEGPAAKDEIIKRVLKERYVKENTILVNLQNREFFRRNKEGKYLIS
ncbi:MAG: HTH domain-containing protein [Candidatus Pacebacteria bacterium]|nr:HTH domain-containing protein [Candidatus Paceibacterota bacterium]